MNHAAPARLTILSGFLGSGKTTWLAHQLRHGAFDGVDVIVNEAAELPVDDRLLPARRLRILAGGCACCTQRQPLLDLIGAMLDGGAGHIVLETSGLAEPARIVEAVRGDPKLADRILIGETVLTLDAAAARDLLRSEPLALRQVEAADAIILTKLPAALPGDAARLVASLRAFVPRAHLFAAERGVEVELPMADDTVPEPPGGPDARTNGGEIVAVTLDLGSAPDLSALTLWLSALLHARGGSVLRVKGVVASGGRRILLQAAGRSVEISELKPEDREARDGLVVIGRGLDAAALADSLRAFGISAAEPSGARRTRNSPSEGGGISRTDSHSQILSFLPRWSHGL